MPLREAELAELLGTSRIPVREALHLLEGEGLVQNRPHRGAVVTPLSPEELNQIADLCRLMEGFLLGHALDGLSRARLQRAEALLQTLEGIADPAEWSRVNWAFHTTLYEAADRPLVLEELQRLRARAERYMLLLLKPADVRRSLNLEHRAILEACRGGRAAEALERLDRHLGGAGQVVLRLLAAPQPGSGPASEA